jgi:hypothetical protein
MMNNLKFACRFFACLIILVLVINFENLLIFRANTSIQGYIFIFALGSLYLVLNLLSVLGLFFGKQWGFWLTYIAIILTTFFFSTSYIPWISNLFQENIRFIPMIISNFVVLISIGRLHFLLRKNR